MSSNCFNITVKPNECENALSEICADKCRDDEVTVPEFHEIDEIQNSDTVNTQSSV
jgi:hypothetical protein